VVCVGQTLVVSDQYAGLIRAMPAFQALRGNNAKLIVCLERESASASGSGWSIHSSGTEKGSSTFQGVETCGDK
jgi:hypothetical protein